MARIEKPAEAERKVAKREFHMSKRTFEGSGLFAQCRRFFSAHAGGASMVEYLVLAGVCALLAIAAFKQFGRQVERKVREEGDQVARLEGGKTTPSTLRGSDGRIYLPVVQAQCFAAGTLVATAFGDRAIESIRRGDLVWSRHEKTGAMELKPVVQTFVTPDQSFHSIRDPIRRTPPPMSSPPSKRNDSGSGTWWWRRIHAPAPNVRKTFPKS